VTLQGRWVREDGGLVADNDIEKNLPYDIEPGDTVGLALLITTPSERGRYYLEVDLVQKGVARFGERGSVPSKFAVEVNP
jgi:hypothetical protein